MALTGRTAVVFCGLAGLFLLGGPAQAQYIEFDAQKREHPLPGVRPSVRLAAMGGLAITIPDENAELTLSDFGQNLSGAVHDREGWSLESWAGRMNYLQDYRHPTPGTIRERNRFQRQTGGVDATYYSVGRHAVGVSGIWNRQVSTSRFDPTSRVRGPNVFGFYNRGIGNLSLALGLGVWSDDEDVLSTDVFAIRHSSKTRSAVFASSYTVGAWDIGGQFERDDVNIEGQSRDNSGFHRDIYRWNRPATRVRLSLIRPEGRLAGGVNLFLLDRTGREEVKISWSDRFPANPGGTFFTLRAPTFEEEEDGLGLESRWTYHFSPAFRIAATGEIQRLSSEVRESPNSNFPGSRREQDIEATRWRAGGGFGWTLFDRALRVGTEGYVTELSSTSRSPMLTIETDSRRFDARVGAEWILESRLVLRGGVTGGIVDLDLNAPGSLYKDSGFTVGLGYVPRGGVFSFDAAWSGGAERPDYTGGLDRKVDYEELTFAFRMLL